MNWPAPAKINLFLHITGQRLDGYHELQTVFQFLDYGDELQFTITQDKNITLSGDLLEIPPQQNLIVKAAHLLQQHSDTPQGCHIHLTKRLPMGGGLGGRKFRCCHHTQSAQLLMEIKLFD